MKGLGLLALPVEIYRTKFVLCDTTYICCVCAAVESEPQLFKVKSETRKTRTISHFKFTELNFHCFVFQKGGTIPEPLRGCLPWSCYF